MKAVIGYLSCVRIGACQCVVPPMAQLTNYEPVEVHTYLRSKEGAATTERCCAITSEDSVISGYVDTER